MANKIEVDDNEMVWIDDTASPGVDAGGIATTPVYAVVDPGLEVTIDKVTKQMTVKNPNVTL